MARLRHFGEATPVLRYSNWIAAALVTLCAVYLHVLFLLNAGGLWRDEAGLVHLSLLPSVSEVWQNLPHDSCPILMHARCARMVGSRPRKYGPWFACLGFVHRVVFAAGVLVCQLDDA